MSYWDVIYRSAWVALAVLFAVGIISMFWPQFRQHQEYQRREAEMQAEIALEEEIIRHLKFKQERMQNDSGFVERVGHDMGLAKPDEVIFKFVDDEPETAPRQP